RKPGCVLLSGGGPIIVCRGMRAMQRRLSLQPTPCHKTLAPFRLDPAPARVSRLRRPPGRACGLSFLDVICHSLMTCLPTARRSPFLGCLLPLSLVLLAGGCGETEQISRYAVPKETPTPTAQRDDVEPDAQPASAWFLKLTGPAEAVATIEDEFRALVESTSLGGGEPTWTLPEGWTQQ